MKTIIALMVGFFIAREYYRQIDKDKAAQLEDKTIRNIQAQLESLGFNPQESLAEAKKMISQRERPAT